VRYLQASDIYITPYIERDQITSGTLAYALGCGKAVISTPYLYATEALAEGRGILAEFQNPQSFARCVNLLLENPALRTHCEQRALQFGQAMSWDNVGRQYAALFQTLLGVASVPDKARDIRGEEKSACTAVPKALLRPAAMTIA
jgi:glycosyltransferase involved in cell wall biosynthesis